VCPEGEHSQTSKSYKLFIAIVIPKLKMATPFLVLKTLTGFDFQFTKV
jgi:hypothetical protein